MRTRRDGRARHFGAAGVSHSVVRMPRIDRSAAGSPWARIPYIALRIAHLVTSGPMTPRYRAMPQTEHRCTRPMPTWGPVGSDNHRGNASLHFRRWDWIGSRGPGWASRQSLARSMPLTGSRLTSPALSHSVPAQPRLYWYLRLSAGILARVRLDLRCRRPHAQHAGRDQRVLLAVARRQAAPSTTGGDRAPAVTLTSSDGTGAAADP
jgi:hypothetical protein